ncbi:MAG: Hsp20 family protein [Chloroflexota bacterium]
MFRQPFNWREMEKLRRDMDRLFEVTTPRLARARSGRFRRERYCDAFERTVQLPYTVDTEGVEASAENGVLTIMLPRAEAEKPRQIEVKTSG